MMALVSARPLSAYPAFVRLFFWNQRRRYGRVLDPGLLWGRSPWVFAAVALLYGALDRRASPLERFPSEMNRGGFPNRVCL